LAVAQRAEQIEKQALAQQRQADAETLERDALLVHLMQAQAHQQVVTLEAQTEALRLAQLEERLHRFPHAAQYDWQSQQLEVARALAGNTRAVLQVGSAGDIPQALLVRDALRDGIVSPSGEGSGDARDSSTHPPSASDSAPAGADATAVGGGHRGAHSQLCMMAAASGAERCGSAPSHPVLASMWPIYCAFARFRPPIHAQPRAGRADSALGVGS
jgi:hypothetical protein